MKPPPLVCSLCGARIDRSVTVLDAPGEPTWPSHAKCRLAKKQREERTSE